MTNEQREELRRNIVSGKFESWLVGKFESWLVGKFESRLVGKFESWLVGKFESWLVVRARIVLDKKPTEGFVHWKGNLIV